MTKKRMVGTVSKMSGFSYGFFEEFIMKKTEAEQRLARVFTVFIKLVPNSGYFICGGNVPFSQFSNSNFGCIIIGSSLVEINQGEDLIRRVGSRINTMFSEKDFHSTVVMDFLSRYLKANLQNMKIPQALAIEFFITDILGNLLRVHFHGAIEIDYVDSTDKDIFMTGGYDEKFRENLLRELKKAPQTIDKEKMTEFAKGIKSKFRLSHVGFVLP